MGELVNAFTSLGLASPFYFLAGGLIILLCIFFPTKEKRKAIVFDRGYYKKKKIELESKKTWLLFLLIIIASALIALTFGDPQSVSKRSIPFYEKPVLVAMDVSGSMVSIYKPGVSKFQKTVEVFYDAKNRDLEATLGLMIFSSDSYISRDFAPKMELLQDTVENEEEVDKVASGTEIAKALAAARLFFSKNVQAKNKSIILISDMEDILPPVAKEIDKNIAAGIKVYGIVIEDNSRLAHERIYQLKDNSINKELKIVWAEDKDGIEQIYKEIMAQQSSLTGKEEILSTKSLVPYFLWSFTGIFLLLAVFSETIFRKIP